MKKLIPKNVWILLAWCTLFSLPGVAQALISPTTQRSASEWLSIKVLNVQKSATHIEIKAQVQKVFVSESNLKPGEGIRILYELKESPSKPIGKSQDPTPPTLGETTYAFLNALSKNGNYTPAAGTWSFSSPVGIWPQVREALDMPIETSPQP